MRSPVEFVVIAALVTLTPGPATAMVLRTAATGGRRAATAAIVGNAGGVLLWGALSAVGVSGLILASRIAYDVLRVGGAVVLVVLGVRALLGRTREGRTAPVARDGFRAGLLTSVSNPKLAVFFVALFPEFLRPGSPVLPYALAMAGVIVAFDLVWYSALAFAVDRARAWLTPRVQRVVERVTGAVMLGFGVRLLAEAR